jgi:hypothetical protein
MSLFRKNPDVGVRTFILKLVNNNCPELKGLMEGPRGDTRVDMVVVVTILPVQDKRPQVRGAFTAVTKEFSSTGVGVVLDRPRQLCDVVLAFRLEEEMVFAWAQGKHVTPMGGGFFQLGFRLTEILSASDYPELQSVRF